MAAVGINIHCLCYLLSAFSILSCLSFIYWSHCSVPCSRQPTPASGDWSQTLDLLSFPSAWNSLYFPAGPPPRRLKIALFVKKWPQRNLAGGMERHALTLHLALARRGHEVHVFTTASPDPSDLPTYPNATLILHTTPATKAGYINQPLAWEQFRLQNDAPKPFDVIHTESVALLHGRARNFSNLAVSWHGIAYETIHSDIVQDLLRSPNETQQPALSERLAKVVDEVKFFRDYAHHVATSDHVGDVLRRIYLVPEDRVHVIVNGVDENIYRKDIARGEAYKRTIGLLDKATLVFGIAGRMVRDKGHPIMFEALRQLLNESVSFQKSTVFLVAGDGPWSNRYEELSENVVVLGPLDQAELASFYNALDIFVNPTLRAQGLDHTIIEAMMSGVPVAGTRFASISGSLIVGPEVGYTFSPTVESLKSSLYRIWQDGRGVLRTKGENARQRALQLFTATKMAAAYERLFLCISNEVGVDASHNYCKYPSKER